MKIGSLAHFMWPIQGVLFFIVHLTLGQTDFVWRTGSWGECQGSSDCGLSGLSGSNKQTRAIWCEDSNGVTTQEANCDPSLIPHKERTCFRVCSEHNYLFEWTLGPWGPCERQTTEVNPTSGILECGPASLGLKHRTVTCNEKNTHFIQKLGDLSIPDSICENFWTKPSISKDCLMPCSQDCVVSDFTEWSDCTQSCGNATKTRSRSVLVAPNEHGANCPPLSETIACEDLPLCPSGDNFEYILKVEMWGACTVSSTATDEHPPVGRMTRDLRCLRNDGEIVDNSLCIGENEILPERSKPCIPSVDCVLSEWSLWSTCPNVCQLPYGATSEDSNSQRFRTRTVVEVPSGRGRLCEELVQYQSCTDAEASLFPDEAGLDCQSSGEYVWFTSEWSPCKVSERNSASCGGGVQTRHVFCIRSSDTEHLPMPSNLCDVSTIPDIHQPCSVPCPVDCLVSSWSSWDQCQANDCQQSGVKKAKGYRTRERHVIIPASSGGGACPHLYENAPCSVPACYTWKVGRVGECRPTDTELNCGEGLLTRDIQCLDSTLQPVNTSWCKALYETPMWEVPCHHPCPNDCVISEWGQWSPCSMTCTGKNQGGVQLRQKVILAHAGPGGQACPEASELIETRQCNDHSCALFAWQTDGWGECVLDTASQARGCGTGVQTRTVECDRVRPRKDAPIQRCKPELEPPGSRPCEVPCPVPCRVSEFTAWSECPTECDGSGSWLFSQIRSRYILQHPHYSGAACPSGFQEERVCSAPESCHSYEWIPSSWSRECKIGNGDGNGLSCGDGFHTRELVCQRGDGRLVGKDLCLKYGSTQPLAIIPCNIPCEDDCQFNPWSLWSHCASCVSKQARSRSLHGASKKNPKCLNKLLYPTIENRTCHCPVYRPHFIGSKSDCIINEIDESPETGISGMELDCGRGFNFQAVQCLEEDGRVVSLSLCVEDSAVKEEPCGVPCPTDCQISVWTNWGSCMTEEGALHGIQTRKRELMQPQFGGRPCPLEANDALFEVQTRPCWPQSEFHMAHWFASDWEECIGTEGSSCGQGAKSRTVRCLRIDEGGFTTNVSSEHCPQESKPEARIPCTKPCDGHCVVSEWTEWIGCPRNCSSAVLRKRHRDILRHPSPGNDACPHLTESQPCMLGIHCFQYFWNTSRWSSCILGDNAECGNGTRIRLLTCVTSTGTEVENDLCEKHASNVKPDIMENCLIECPLDCKMSPWSVWSLCPNSCGMHRVQTRTRTVLQHPNDRGRPCPEALTQTKPCEPVPCYTFKYSEWGPCMPQGECGSGLRHRNITCHQPNGVEVEFDLCLKFSTSLYDSNRNISQRGFELLQREEECQIPCPGECQRGDWSQWSACHIHCANGRRIGTQGIQVRSRASLTQRADCPGDHWDTRTCHGTVCFEFMWQTGAWNQGLREVWCQRSDGVNVTGGCSKGTKPNAVALCTGGCPVVDSYCARDETCLCRQQYKPMFSQESGQLAECVLDEDKNLIPFGPTKQPARTESTNKGELGGDMFPFDFLTIMVLGTAAVVISVMVIVVCAICCCCSKKSSNKKNDDKLPQPQYRDYSNSFWDENAKMKYTGEIDL